MCNAGPADNTSGFTLSDPLPAGLTFQALASDPRCTALGQDVTCTNALGLPAGADDVFVLHVRLAPTVDAGTVLSNTALVSSSGTDDPDASNDTSAALSTTVLEDVQLGVTKAFGSATVTAGGASGTFTVSVTNSGASDADQLVVSDSVDSRLSVDSIAAGAFDCSFGSGQAIDCHLAHLAAGASVSFTVTYHVVAAVVAATVANQAAATSDEDSALGGDSVEVLSSAGQTPTPTPTPSPSASDWVSDGSWSASGSLADTSVARLAGQVSPAMLLLALAAWVTLLTGLAVESARRRGNRR